MKEKPKSSCCQAEIKIEEKGVSQISYDVDFFCTKCGKKLEDVKISDYHGW